MTELFGLSIVIIASIVNVVIMLLSHRISARFGYIRSVFAGFIAGLTIIFFTEWYRFSAHPFPWIEGVVLVLGDILVYGFGAFFFFNVINVGESSIRVRILRELSSSRDKMSEQNLLNRYNDQIILNTRLQRLLHNKQILFVDQRYVYKPSILLVMALIVRAMKIAIVGRASEFDLRAHDEVLRA